MREAPTIGVDVGGTNIRAGLIGADGTILRSVVARTDRNPVAALSQIVALVNELDAPKAGSVGVGLPCRVDARKGVAFPGGYVKFTGEPIVEPLESALGKRVAIDNDGTMALIAESRLGAAKGKDNVVLLAIGTGIGGAVMLDGKIARGAATAGQLGHVAVDTDGLLCACGKRGCVETRSAGLALARLISQAGLDPETRAEDLLARRGSDAKAAQILDAWARPLRAAIDTLVAVLAPEIILLGGGLGAAAHEALKEHPAPSAWFQCPIAPAALGDKAGLIGAGLAARASRGALA